MRDEKRKKRLEEIKNIESSFHSNLILMIENHFFSSSLIFLLFLFLLVIEILEKDLCV